MQYRRFGKTEMHLSVFSLGGMRFIPDADNAVATITRAIDLGINHIETAKGYGNSEALIGLAIDKGLRSMRDQLYITTKIPPTASAQNMRVLIEQSLSRMQVDYIDNFDLHGINTWEHYRLITDPEGCMQAVTEAVTKGLIRHVGFSTHAPLDVLLATIQTDLFSSVNLHYYYFNQRNAPAISLSHAKDMGVFIISPSDKGGMLYTPPPLLAELCKPFTPVYINDRFLLADQRIHTLSLGARHPQELETHQPAWENTAPLSEEERQVIALLDRQFLSLGLDRCSQCFQCLPCPEEINIPEVLRLRNLAVAFDMTDFGKYRYKMFENAGHWFPGRKANKCTDCGDCLPRCPVKLNIPELLRDTHQRLHTGTGKRLWE